MATIKALLTTAQAYDATVYAPPVLAEIANISGLTAALAGKAAADHDHAIGEVTGLQDALDGKVDVT